MLHMTCACALMRVGVEVRGEVIQACGVLEVSLVEFCKGDMCM